MTLLSLGPVVGSRALGCAQSAKFRLPRAQVSDLWLPPPTPAPSPASQGQALAASQPRCLPPCGLPAPAPSRHPTPDAAFAFTHTPVHSFTHSFLADQTRSGPGRWRDVILVHLSL